MTGAPGINGVDTSGGVEHQHPANEVHCVRALPVRVVVRPGAQTLDCFHALPLRELHAEVREGGNALPRVSVWGSKLLEDAEDAFPLGGAREQRTQRHHLHKNAPATPDVDSDAILDVAKQNLWRAVPRRYGAICVIAAFSDVEPARHAEVCHLGMLSRGVEKNIVRLHIAVEDAAVMAVGDRREDLSKEGAAVVLRHPLLLHCIALVDVVPEID
eukprot:3932079-Rhodomonas_salina.1